MKKFNEKFGLLGWLLLISVFAMGAKIGDDVLRVGTKTGADIEIQMGEGRLKWDQATSKMQFSNDSGVSIKDIGSGGGAASGINLLENADFESGNPPANWTASAGTFIAETANPGFDVQSGSWDAAAASDTLDSDFQSVPLGLENRGCNATMQYKYATGTSGDYKLQVIGNTAGLIAETDLNVVSDWTPASLYFTCPTTDSVKLRVTSTVNGGIVLIDNATLGKTNFVQAIAKNQIETKFLSANVTSTGTIADLTFTNLEIGKVYEFSGQYSALLDSGAAANNASMSVEHNGVTLGQSIFSISETTDTLADQIVMGFSGKFTATATTLTFVANAVSANAPILGTGDRAQTYAQLEKRNDLGGNFQEGLTIETIGEHWDVSIGGANPSLGSSAVAAYTSIGNAGLDMVINGNSGSAQIPCDGGNPSTGLTCAAGSEAIGIVFNASTSGRYRVCSTFNHWSLTDAAGTVETVFQWGETSNTSGVIIQEGNSRIESSNDVGGTLSGNAVNPINVCGDFNFSTAGQKTLRLFFEQSATATISTNQLLLDRASNVGQRDLHITVDKLDQQMPTPAFTDLTNSLNSKIEINTDNMRAVAADVSGACSINNEFGNFIDTCVVGGVGDTTINFVTGTFSATPVCVSTAASNGNVSVPIGTLTASQMVIRGYDAGTGTLQDVRTMFYCIGPK